MKATLVALLAVLLCVERVSSLVCFECENQETNWKCLNVKRCDEEDKYCVTGYFGKGFGTRRKQYITKTCAPTCSEESLDLGLVALSHKCCQGSLCNLFG